jgi:hypothetical protein
MDPRLQTAGERPVAIRDVGGRVPRCRSARASVDDPSRRLRPAGNVTALQLARQMLSALPSIHDTGVRRPRARQPDQRSRGGVGPGYGKSTGSTYMSVGSSYSRAHDHGLPGRIHGSSWLPPTGFRSFPLDRASPHHKVLGYGISRLSTSMAERYRERLREMERLAREARESHGP